MKKDDIIAQKLFETCKLSEFYLNLLKQDDDSPMQLAHAYKTKLYEIVNRYDRLLDANEERQKLKNYDFELQTNSKTLKSKSKNLLLSKTSTPNKSMSALNTPSGQFSGQLPISVLTSSSSTYLPPNSNSSSYASTPATTPCNPIASKTFGSRTGLGSSRSIYSQAYQQHHYSNKQMQKYAHLYADTSSSSESDESEVEEEEEDNEDFYSNNLKCQLEYVNYRTNNISNNKIENRQKNKQQNTQEISNSESEEDHNIDNNIEKSYSNLSKDSGVFGESYHSECSNRTNKQNISISDHEQNESCEDRISDEETNLTSPVSSSLSSNNHSRCEETTTTSFHSHESTPKTLRTKREDSIEIKPQVKNDSFIWGSVKSNINVYNNNDNNIERQNIPIKPVKPNFFLNKLNTNKDEQEPRNLLKSSMNNNLLKQTTNFNTITKSNNNNDTYNVDIDNIQLKSMRLESSEPQDLVLKSTDNSLLNESNIDNKNSSFIFNYNSLMNVSMLDNIQAVNTIPNSEIDMNCSILMFN